MVPRVRTRLQCAGSSAASFASGGGGIGGGGSGGGGGGGGGEGGEPKAVPLGAEDASSASSDVIILDVGVSIFPLQNVVHLCLFPFLSFLVMIYDIFFGEI